MISDDKIVEAKETALIVKMSEESVIEDDTAHRHNEQSSCLVESLKVAENFSKEGSMTTSGSILEKQEIS